MIYKGIASGKIIELEEPLPYPEGQPVSVLVEPLVGEPQGGSPSAVLQAMTKPPHLRWEDVDELERAIEEGKLAVRQKSVFEDS